MSERAALFGEHRNLVGIITDAAAPDASMAAVFLNAGVIHRVGPTRLYVQLARTLAACGWTAVRFDHSGIGDSPVRPDGRAFAESALDEARQVMDAIEASRGIRRFVLIGLCSGAVTAFDAAALDPRVAGIVMINPQGFDDDARWNEYVLNRGQARKYWTQSLFSVRSWTRALTGRIDYARLAAVLWRQVTAGVRADDAVVPVATRVASAFERLQARAVRLLLVCSEGDDGIEYMNVILEGDVRKLPRTPALQVEILDGADHSLTLRASQRRIEALVRDWAEAFAQAPSGAAAGEMPAGEAVPAWSASR